MAANLRFSSHTIDGKLSLGGDVVTTASGIYSPSTTSSNVLFDEVLKSENMAGTPDYRCVYLKNDPTGTESVYNPQIIFKTMSNVGVFEIGFLTDKNVLGEKIPDENTAPTGITFTRLPDNVPSRLILGTSSTLGPNEFVGFWLKRTPTNLGSTGTVTGEFSFQIDFNN